MKKITFTTLLLVGLFSVKAQTNTSDEKKFNLNHFSMGFHLNNFQNDFGFGINATSPYFVHHSMAVTTSYNIAYRGGIINTDSVYTWYPYNSLKVGLIGVAGKIGESLRLYGGGGLLVLMPNQKFGSKKIEIGGYGLWGFEFIMNPGISYYIELGGVGVGATADRMTGRPIYSNGFATTVGLKFYF